MYAVVFGQTITRGGEELERLIADDATPVVADQMLSADLDGEVVMINLSKGVYYGLEGVGSRVWELVQERRTLREMREEILTEYDVEPKRLEQDLQAVLGKMVDQGLIEVE